MGRGGTAKAGIGERLWAKIDKRGPDECWPWTGATSRGYGRIVIERKPRVVSRLIYEVEVGPIPEGLNVLHSCDNPPCCNPAHLRVGTQKENSADMLDRERQASRLTDESVTEIRRRYAAGESQAKLAAEFDVAISTVAMATRGDTWGHLPAGAEAQTGEGLCACGCGLPTPIAKMTNARLGHVKGQPTRYRKGHGSRGRRRVKVPFGSHEERRVLDVVQNHVAAAAQKAAHDLASVGMVNG